MGWVGVLLVPSIGVADAQVVAVPVGEADRAAVAHLRRQLDDVSIAIREPEQPRALSRLMDEARARGQAMYIVVLDGADAAVHVLRPDDGTRLSRRLEPSTARGSAYILALAARELLQLARQAPRADAAALPPVRGRQGSSFPNARVTVGLGAEASVSPSHDGSVVRPKLQLGVTLGAAEGWFLRAGARAGVAGRWSRRLGTVTPDGGAVRIRHVRSGLAGFVGAGLRHAEAAVAAVVLAGASFARTRAVPTSDPRPSARKRTSGWLGAGVQMSHRLGAGFGVAVAVDVVWVPSPTRYLVGGKPALQEGPARVQAGIAFLWGFAP